jgi:hypothetical protein
MAFTDISTHFRNLGLPREASMADVKRAYRRLAFKTHPDHNDGPNAEAEFSRLQDSYQAILAYFSGKYVAFTAEQSYQTPQPSASDKARAERVRAAKERAREKIRKENEMYQAAFNNINNTWKIKFISFIAVLCAIAAAAAVTDFSLKYDAEKNIATPVSIDSKTKTGIIFVAGRNLAVTHEIYYAVAQKYPVILHRSRIFKEICGVSSHTYRHYYHAQVFNIISLAPISAFFLLIPAASFRYRKADFTYTVLYALYCIYIAPVLLAYLLFGNMRIFKAAGIYAF